MKLTAVGVKAGSVCYGVKGEPMHPYGGDQIVLMAIKDGEVGEHGVKRFMCPACFAKNVAAGNIRLHVGEGPDEENMATDETDPSVEVVW